MRASLVLLLAITASAPLSADTAVGVLSEVSVQVIKPDGATRYYTVTVGGENKVVQYDQTLPIVRGDSVRIVAQPVLGSHGGYAVVGIRLGGRDLVWFNHSGIKGSRRQLGPWSIVIKTDQPYLGLDLADQPEDWANGLPAMPWVIETFVQAGKNEASGIFRIAVTEPQDDPASVAHIATLEKLVADLTRQSAEQKTAYKAEKARLTDEQTDKVRRWQEAIAVAEPIAVGDDPTTAPLTGFILQDALVAGGGVSYSAPPSKQRRPRSKKITLQNIGELIIQVPGRQVVRVDYQTADGRSLSKVWDANGTLTLQKVSVPLTVTVTTALGNVRVTRELTIQNPTAIFNLGGVQ